MTQSPLLESTLRSRQAGFVSYGERALFSAANASAPDISNTDIEKAIEKAILFIPDSKFTLLIVS